MSKFILKPEFFHIRKNLGRHSMGISAGMIQRTLLLATWNVENHKRTSHSHHNIKKKLGILHTVPSLEPIRELHSKVTT